MSKMYLDLSRTSVTAVLAAICDFVAKIAVLWLLLLL